MKYKMGEKIKELGKQIHKYRIVSNTSGLRIV